MDLLYFRNNAFWFNVIFQLTKKIYYSDTLNGIEYVKQGLFRHVHIILSNWTYLPVNEVIKFVDVVVILCLYGKTDYELVNFGKQVSKHNKRFKYPD